MKIRIKFTKHGLIKFIGHLDLMRAWQKIFRRSGIPIAYSEGFNPHQIFSIASPLAVGITSDGEYLDLKLSVEAYDLEKLKQQINAVCPKDILVLEAIQLADGAIASMAACYASSYGITLSKDLKSLLGSTKGIEAFFAREEIFIRKKNKKGKFNDFDLKPGIFSYELSEDHFKVLLATGSTLNVKPELIMNALFDYLEVSLPVFTAGLYYTMHRNDLYMSINPLVTLIEQPLAALTEGE